MTRKDNKAKFYKLARTPTGKFEKLKQLDKSIYNLAYAIKERALVDLAQPVKDETEPILLQIEFLKSFMVENAALNDILITRALERRFCKMKLNLDEMYKDMLADDKQTAPATVNQNEADKIEEALEKKAQTPAPAAAQPQAQAQAQASAPVDTTNLETEKENNENDN